MIKRKQRFLSVALAALLCSGLFATASVAASAEEDISTVDGLEIRLDAQSLSLEDGASVARIANNGNSGDAVQSDADRQPRYVASSNLNGLPALRFSSESYMTIEDSGNMYLEDMTVFVVANASGLPAHGEILSRVANGSPWNHNWFLNIEDGLLNYGWGTATAGGYAYPQSKVTISANTPYVLTAKKSGIDGSVYVNGIPVGTFIGSTACNPVSAPVTLGGSSDSFIGDIGEVLVYNRGLTESETLKVERYLEERWGMENLHEGLLTSISVKGVPLTQFRADVYDYSCLADAYLTQDDITFTKWNAADTARIRSTEGGFEIEVTGANTGIERVYRLTMKQRNYEFNEIQLPSADEVKINDGFWSKLYRQYSVHTVNFMFDMFDKSLSFDNFDRVADGEKMTLGNLSAHAAQILKPVNDRDVYSTNWEWIYEPWREGLIYEGIRAAGEFVIVNKSDADYFDSVAALTERVNGYVDRIYAAALQTTAKDANGKPIDGYFSTFNILNQRYVADESEVSGRYHHDIYNYGCLAEAAVYWYNATGDTRLLFAATRFTEFLIDYINGRDGFEGYKVVPPHELPEEALQRLYDLYAANPSLVGLMEQKYSCVEGLSPDDRYYKLEIRLDEYAKIAASWITDRGNSEGRYNLTNYGSYAQDDTVYTQLTDATGHAVRANLWYNGMAYIGNRQGNEDFVAAAERIWRNIVGSQMYITGGTGSTNDGEEAYGGSGQLPHNGYCETCAAVGMAFFAQNMFRIFGEAEYADVVELEMYNNILGCLGLDGNSFYYTNPLVSDDYTRPMFSNATPCCVPMFLKFFSELPELIYAKTQNAVFVNQYISGSLQTDVGGKNVTVIQGTDMPNGNSASFTVVSDGSITLKLRVPSWANGAAVFAGDEELNAVAGEDGYIDVTVNGKAEIRVEFVKEVQRVYQDNAEANRGMVAFRYGSFVYCAEEADNTFTGIGNILQNANLTVSDKAKTEVIYTEDMFSYDTDCESGIPVGVNLILVEVYCDRRVEKITLLPFYLRGNRQTGYMTVWLPEG